MSAPELVRIPFHGDEVLAVEVDGKPHIVLKPAFEAIGLDADQQIRKLQRQPWSRTVVTTVQADDQRRSMVVADVRTFLMGLAGIPAARVAEHVRPTLVAYQSEVADAIEAYWTKGGVLNPRASQDQLAAIIDRARAQAEVLRTLDGIVDRHWLEAKARHVAARALGEEPEVDPSSRPLTVGEYLSDRGVPASQARALSSGFGKRVKAAYVLQHGTQPPSVDRFVDGALRRVCGYTEADRGLFDQAWAQVAPGGGRAS